MMRRIATSLLVLAIAGAFGVPLFAQKGPSNELGFHAGKLYDFTEIDSVNLYNGNLMLTVRLGPKYQVSPALSYQFTVVYNGKMWDFETHDLFNSSTEVVERWTGALPNRRSNAGAGWRISLGRLLPPWETSNEDWRRNSSDERNNFIYEGPSGDEHAFGNGLVATALDGSALRLVHEDVAVKYIEFPSGERHRFDRQDGLTGAFRLTEMADRFGNWVRVAYTPISNNGEIQTITDSVGRRHTFASSYQSAFKDSVDRGQNIHTVILDGANGTEATYSLRHEYYAVRYLVDRAHERTLLPMLVSIEQPDGSTFKFDYYTDPYNGGPSQGALKSVELPTGGTTEYNYAAYEFASKKACGNSFGGSHDVGVRRRTIADRSTAVARVWDYVQRRGPSIPVNYPDPYGDYCCREDTFSSFPVVGPFYWVRTSVLAPQERGGDGKYRRMRTDHYFDALAFDYEVVGCTVAPPPEPTFGDEWAKAAKSAFSYPGTIAMPPAQTAKGPLVRPDHLEDDEYPDDVPAVDSDGRRLTTQVYTGCAVDGDCTQGELKRSTYTLYEVHPLSSVHTPYRESDNDVSQRLKSSRTVFHDDPGCQGECWTATTSADDNGAGVYRKVTETSNFPGSGTVTTITDYATFDAATLSKADTLWMTGAHSGRTREEVTVVVENGVTRTKRSKVREQVCYDKTTGFVKAQRILADPAGPGPSDVLNVFLPSKRGDVRVALTYGGAHNPISDAPDDLCDLDVDENAWFYKIENSFKLGQAAPADGEADDEEPAGGAANTSYTGGHLVWSRYYDRATRKPMPFKTADRTIDRFTGAVTSTRDSAGFGTTYTYEPLPVRLQSVTPDGGATSSYEYQNATAAKNARVVETVTGPDHDTPSVSTYEFDGLGRVKRVSRPLPSGKVAVVETDYDEVGRQSRVTQPVEADAHPDTPVSGYGTGFSYDVFGRQNAVTAPDGSVTRFDYVGVRKMTRTSSAATSASGKSDTKTTETYDGAGRLLQVEEDSRNTSATKPKGETVSTTYGYDVAGRLTSVLIDDGTTKQPRSFEYDGRGFLIREDHPENGPIVYGDYDARGHAWKRTAGGSTLAFTFDSAERLTDVATSSGEPVKKFIFGTILGYDLGKVSKAIRYNHNQSAGRIDVTETYEYGTPSGQLSGRTTLVESVASTTRTPLQRFTYGVDYDDLLLPKNLRMPRCSLNGCSADAGIDKVVNTRTAGYLTSVAGPDQLKFADLTYHPSGMVQTVKHGSAQKAVDTYASRYGMPRPSRITFTGCTNTKPYFLPGPVVVKPEPSACGLQITWPAATLCGGAGGIKYKVLRNGTPISECLTETKFVDTDLTQHGRYTYTIIAEGSAAAGGTGTCNAGETTEIVSSEKMYQGCEGQTSVSVASVNASVGTFATLRATLTTPSGPVQDEELVFSVSNRRIGSARTAANGTATLRAYVDVPPATYQDAISVSYAGGLLQPSNGTGMLAAVCDAPSYFLGPTSLSVRPMETRRPPINVTVTTSTNCSWKPERDSLAFFKVLPIASDTGAPKTHTGSSTFAIDIDPYFGPAGTTLTSYVTAGFRRVRVEQTGSCSYRFEPGIAYVPAETRNTTSSMNVVAPEGCNWTVKTDAPWIRLISASGTGAGSVTFRVDPNTGAKRFGELSIDAGEGATAAVNQYGIGRAVCPELTSDLSGGGAITNGQNVSMRVIVTGTQLSYEWWVNNRRAYTCEASGDDIGSCEERTIGPGRTDYPAPGETVTFQVHVYNSCGSVTSRTVSWTNTTAPESACRVPLLKDSTFGTNEWPADQSSPMAGSTVTMRIVAEDVNPKPMPPLTYQWYQGMSGDRSAKLQDGNADAISVSPYSTSYYWVEVTNGCGANQSRTAEITITSPPRRRVVRFDFNSDGATDLIWRNATTGQNELWTMSGTNHTGTQVIETNPNTNAQIQSYGDFDRDGRADLVWRDPVTGKNDVWIMNGRRRSDTVPLEPRAGSGWSIGAVADFDNDEHHDIVWHNNATGENEIWFQHEAERDGTWALPRNAAGGWGLHGTADFNNDDRPDLFFHDRATGASSVWLMNDAERASVSSNSTVAAAARRKLRVTSQSIPAQTDRNLVPALVSDMNFDGRPDIVWRNVVTGENSVWLMNGTTRSSVVSLEPRSDTNWQMGGGGSTNAGPAGGGSEPRAATALELVAEPASSGSTAAVTATLSASGVPLAQREVIFSIDGIEAVRLLTGANGVAEAAIAVGDRAAGTYAGALSARFEGNTTDAPSEANTALVVSSAAAVITWGNPVPIVYGTPLGAVQLNASADVSGTFVYDPPAGTVLRAGYNTLSVTFTPADTTMPSATRSVVIEVTKAPSSVSWVKPAPIAYGVPLSAMQLNATSAVAGSFSYEPPAGTLLGVGAAQVLRVTFTPDDASFEASTTTTTVDVAQGTQILQWTDPAPIAVGDALGPQQLNATVLTSGTAPAGTVTYDPPLGTVLPLGVHELSVSVAETAEYRPASLAVDILVSHEATTLQWASPGPIVYGTPLSASQLNATASVPGTFTYTPAAGAILDAGSHRLSVTFTPADARYESASATVAIDVAKARPTLAWSRPAAIVYGTALSAAQLNATADTPGVFTYTPETGAILNAGAARELTARFTPLDVRNHEHATIKVLLDVSKAPQTIVWPAPAPIVYGTALSPAQLNATVQVAGASPAGALTYAPAAGTLLQAGLAQVLTVTAAATDNYESATQSVSIDVSRAQPAITWVQPQPIVYKTLLDAAELNATANVPGTFDYTPPAGTLLQAGSHTLSAQFTPSDSSNYESTSTTVRLEVRKARPVITWSRPASIVYGTALSAAQLNAAADVPGAFAYTPAPGTILDAGNGRTLTVRFTPADGANYEEGEGRTAIDVARAPQTIVWSDPAAIVYGAPLSSVQLNATVQVGGPSPAGPITYTPPAGTLLQAGAGQLLTATAGATENYEPATKSVAIDVLKAKPVLSWPQPAPIVYKTLLGATQLNATADVPGTFDYTPPAGTLLQAGSHTLSAQFTPSDSRNYEDGSIATELEVQRADPVLTWTAPAGIVYGTALSAAQLNASADVPGTFVYQPPLGTILDAGDRQTLSVQFEPQDSRNYKPADASTTIDVARAPQKIVWPAAAPIVYGTALSATQLNAQAEVVGPATAGSLTYTPAAGTVLDAGPDQTLSVVAAETSNYLPASATIALDVLRAPLSLTTHPQSKLYGGPVPPLTGVVTGVVNKDAISASYSTTATQQSPAGTYAISAALVDPNGRLVNYDVTVTPSTLSLLPAPLTIAANAASKQYSDPLPPFTATFTGLVLGETPAVLTGTLSLQTPAEPRSAPGTYPIEIGGLSSPNYAITYTGSTLTVTPEDARVTITSPRLLTASTAKPTEIMLSATVQDISATADANGDSDQGDVRKATLTFIERATGTVLCVAALDLVAPADERTAVGTCSFSRDFGTALPASLTVAARVADHYIRDAVEDDATLTIVAPTADFITGGGAVTVTSAAGPRAADPASRANFTLNLQYEKTGAVKGKLTFSFTRVEEGLTRRYELAASNVGSLAIRRTAAGGIAAMTGTATLRDVTVATAPVVVAADAPFVVTATDAAEPRKPDALAVTLLDRNGGLWLVTGWSGVQPLEQAVTEGSIQVHFRK